VWRLGERDIVVVQNRNGALLELERRPPPLATHCLRCWMCPQPLIEVVVVEERHCGGGGGPVRGKGGKKGGV
jgi:hypothetical protein